ncbi:disintegrin and metalloproteinase domain-containing protein 12-like isoform X1 [Styela clava]
MMGFLQYVIIAYTTCFHVDQVLSVSATGHVLLDSLNEFYIFKPVKVSHNTMTSNLYTFSTLLSKDHGIHEPEIEISFRANGTNYNLKLKLNEDFISQGFSTSNLGAGENGQDIFEVFTPKEINNCYYHGHIVGMNNSQVVASTCNGLRGTIFLPHDVLQFSPIDEHYSMHALYRPQETENHSCGTKHFKAFQQGMTVNEDLSTPIRLKRATDEKKFIELLIVVDNKLFKKFGSNRPKLYEHIKEVVNYLDALYKKLELRIVLLHVEVWEKEDKIVSDAVPENVLSAFLSYRMDRIQTLSSDSPWTYTDNAQLFYGGSFVGTTVGMATVSTMCSLRSGGVNEDRANALQTSSTVAHEMGHNLGMSHDTAGCRCSGNKCVMAPTSGSVTPDAWSSCSVDYLHKGYTYGTANCLLNVPDSSRLFGGPKCGNGIVEKGEKCDCGLPDECQSKCCNATTCQLHPEAQCDDGTCCTSDCKFKSSCIVCRPNQNDCDIAEYCSGFSAHCPSNIHKIDGMDCNTGGGICYGGVCRTHDMQCQEIWGADSKSGEDVCYRVVNKKGDSNGNCGKEGGTFKKCTPENSLCGKLLCVGGKHYPLIASDRIFFRNTIGDLVCKSLSSVNDSTDAGDAGAVWDGTKCGEGKICFDGSCRNVSRVLKPCTSNCNGHGLCNNFGNCHCEAGWAPPDCKKKGNGGSADSGPICADGVDMQVVLMLVFFLVILPIILAIIAVIWWRNCGGKQKVYAWRKNRDYRKGKPSPRTVDNEARKANASASHSAPPNTGIKPVNNSRPSYPNVTIEKPPTSPPHYNPPRPPPPAKPSPRTPARPAPPPAPAKPQMPQKPIVPPVSYRRAPDVTNKPSVPGKPSSSVQDRIAQLQRNNAV